MKKKTTTILAALIATSILSGCGGITIATTSPAGADAPLYVDPVYTEEASTMEYTGEVSDDKEYNGAYVYDDEPIAAAAPQYIEPEYCEREACDEESASCYDALAFCPDTSDQYCNKQRFCNPGREKYSEVSENPFKDVASDPLSTFGADIDTASYTNLRRMITDGYTKRDIPAGSIRTEELVNYFDYDYRDPKNGEMFAVNAQIIDCPWNKDTMLVNLGIKAKELSDTKDILSNIVFLIDVSGSMMSQDKLPLLQMGFDMLIDDLNENDRISIVTYASSSDVVLSGVGGNEHSKIKRAVKSLEAGGSTNGGDGIITAYRLAEKYFIDGGNNRVIMVTDGDLNVGITSQSELEDLISKEKESGVFLSVLGFGTGNYNETTLETLADKGNGNYSYIDCLAEAKKVLVDEFGSTLFTVAKDVKFQIEFNPKYVASYRQIGYENRQMGAKDFNDDTKDGGEIGSGHTMTVMYEIELAGAADDESPLRYQEAKLSDLGSKTDEWMTLSVRYKLPQEEISKLMVFPISKKCYTDRPNDDTLFAAYVAECGMILNDSEYVGDKDLRDVSRKLSKLDLNDEYKEEFAELIELL